MILAEIHRPLQKSEPFFVFGDKSTMPIIDNIDNNTEGAMTELSDLYGCKVPMSVKVVGGIPKSKKVDFASFEHAWCMRRMIYNPHIGNCRSIVTVSSMQQLFITTHEDAACFLTQFETNGVFASWSKTNEFYPVHQITSHAKDVHNIGLIMRFVCSNHPKGEKIRQQIRGVAADRWKTHSDVVARSIACCLWLRQTPNCSSYETGLRNLARCKYRNNPAICNVLVMTHGQNLQTSFAKCSMVTSTRKTSSDAYMVSLANLSTQLEYKLSSEILLPLMMAFQRRLGHGSLMGQITIDVFLIIIGPLLDINQHKRIKQMFTQQS